MANRRCFECDAPVEDPWVSMSYGITLCLNCAGKHRALGTHNSYVKSWTMDEWTEEMKRVLKAGGNDAALEQFNLCGIYDLPIEKRYASREAHEYSFALYKRANAPVPLGFLPPDRCKTAEELRAEPDQKTLRTVDTSSIRNSKSKRLCCGLCPC